MITAQIICNIIQNYLDLSEEQIWIYNQRRKIPPTEGLFVVVGLMSTVPYGNNVKFLVGSGSGLEQEISQMMQETLTINMFSYDLSALERMPECIGSFQTVYSEQMQEKYAMQIGVVPTNVSDTSFVEASAILYRQTITLRVLRAYSKISQAQYFDEFKTDIYDSSGKVN